MHEQDTKATISVRGGKRDKSADTEMAPHHGLILYPLFMWHVEALVARETRGSINNSLRNLKRDFLRIMKTVVLLQVQPFLLGQPSPS
jgi:hypothetical protein